jgi:hypothetical protein
MTVNRWGASGLVAMQSGGGGLLPTNCIKQVGNMLAIGGNNKVQYNLSSEMKDRDHNELIGIPISSSR